jgi:hypothetical protein
MAPHQDIRSARLYGKRALDFVGYYRRGWAIRKEELGIDKVKRMLGMELPDEGEESTCQPPRIAVPADQREQSETGMQRHAPLMELSAGTFASAA